MLGNAEGAETTGSGLGELLLAAAGAEGGGGGAEGAETADGNGAGEGDRGAFGATVGWLTEKGGDVLTGGAEGVETGLGDGDVTLAAVAGKTGGTETGAGRLTAGGGVIGGLL
jgi:hypothetical protein